MNNNIDNKSEIILNKYFSQLDPGARTSDESSQQADTILSILKEESSSEKSSSKVIQVIFTNPINWLMRHPSFAYSSAAIIIFGLAFIIFGQQGKDQDILVSNNNTTKTYSQANQNNSLLTEIKPEIDKITSSLLSKMILNLDSRAFGNESSGDKSNSHNFDHAKDIILKILNKNNITIAVNTDNKIITDWKIILVNEKYYNSRLVTNFDSHTRNDVNFYLEKYELKEINTQENITYSEASYQDIIKSIKKNYYSK